MKPVEKRMLEDARKMHRALGELLANVDVADVARMQEAICGAQWILSFLLCIATTSARRGNDVIAALVGAPRPTSELQLLILLEAQARAARLQAEAELRRQLGPPTPTNGEPTS